MDKKHLTEAVKYLSDAGISFTIYHAEGSESEISAENVIKYVDDPQKYWADFFDVSVEVFRQYESYLNEYSQCTATTAKRKRCSRKGGHSAVQNFRYGETTLCSFHEKHALKNF